MSNKASDQLHRLIHSMSKPEKRYFKVYTSRNADSDDNNYQLLFDAIDRQEEYNEEKLLKKLADKALTNRFSIAKNRLYNAILRSLDAYHMAGNKEAQLHRQIHSAAILFHKSLYDQSYKILESARKAAEKNGFYAILAEISQWEKRIIERSQYEDVNDINELDEMLNRDRALTEQQSVINELWHIKSRVFHHLYRQGKARNSDEQLSFQELTGDRMSALIPQATSPRAQYLVNHIYSAYYYGTGDYERCYPYLEKNLALMELEAELFHDEPSSYLSVLTNAMYVSMRLGKWKESFRMMDKLREFRERPEWDQHEDFRLRLFSIGVSAELALFAQSGEFESGIHLREEIEEGLQKYEGLISSVRYAHFCFNLAVCYFGMARYNEAHKWLNRLMNEIPIDKTRDLHCMAQLLNLVVYLELGDDRMLPYALRSAQRFLETRRKIHRVEEVILQFVNDSLKKRKQTSDKERYQQLADALNEIRNEPHEQMAFEFFDFQAWARSKATGLSYREVLAA
jgi:hypothetical protein